MQWGFLRLFTTHEGKFMERDNFGGMLTTTTSGEYQLMKSMLQAIERLLAGLAEIERLKKKEYLTPAEVQLIFGLKASTLANKRMGAGGPEYIKDGEKILYKRQAIRDYLDKKTVKTWD